jgi:hypothetical protein
MENLDMLHDFFNTLWPFAVFYGKLVQIVAISYIYMLSTFWYIVSRKIWQPCSKSERRRASIVPVKGSIDPYKRFLLLAAAADLISSRNLNFSSQGDRMGF